MKPSIAIPVYNEQESLPSPFPRLDRRRFPIERAVILADRGAGGE